MTETDAEGYNPSRYSFMLALQCTSEEEVARAMEKLMMPIVGLCLEGINVTLMRIPDDEDEKKHD